MAHEKSVEDFLGGLCPSDRDAARLIAEGDCEWVWDLSDEHAVALLLGLHEGYLRWPADAPLPIQVQHLYVGDREIRGRTAVVIYRSGEARSMISAFCFVPERFAQLHNTAERVGVEVDIARPESGTLTGWVDAGRVDDAARQLIVLRSGPDLTASNRSSSAPRDCRHQPRSTRR